MTVQQPGISFRRRPLLLALALAIVFVIAALWGARYVYDQARYQPVSVANFPAPAADSPACATMVAQAPTELDEFVQVPLVDPAPAGVVAWVKDSTQRIVSRCGVDLPAQYDRLSKVLTVDDVDWILVVDTTPGVDLASFYTINTAATIAVTGPRAALTESVLHDFTALADPLKTSRATPAAAPLAELPMAASADTAVCSRSLEAFSTVLADDEDYVPATTDQLEGAGFDPATTRAWIATGYEPVVVRCGVENSANYAPTAILDQVDSVPFFTDTTLAQGTTSAVYYPQGTRQQFAISAPQQIAQPVLVTIAGLITSRDL
ncbi:DUF3515 family protein [Corynebacterium choanae]|uniref:DUF3515 domain-containing protein n=1 Tax=Corynebacterium choanae TaxID=1862358 RepID=A0A3G6J644_9CORY|nr:DUF3515 family protein [Corynebacterium choanae]AZA13409.1 hypothetical protein CCHOA_05015 [Corynebacterium choanae]